MTRSVTSSSGSPSRRWAQRRRRVEPHHGVEQLARVGIDRRVEDLVEIAALDDQAVVHDQHPVGDLGDDAEVVGDQDRRQAAFAVEPLEQGEDLGLHGDVERRRRLVGDQDLGLERQRHRDHRPLAHPARELVRVVVDALGGVGDADRVEQLDRALARLGLARLAVVCPDRLAICQPIL